MNRYNYEPGIINIDVIDDYKILVKFSDNIDGIIDCKHILNIPMFIKLIDYEYFKSASISVFGRGDITWPNGEDISATSIYKELTHKQK